MDERQIYYFLAIKEIVELFAEQELGSRCEIDVKATMNYVQSMKFVNDTWGLKSKDEIYKLVTDDILNGFPIWQLLNMPEWTRSMCEREFGNAQKQKRKELEKKYQCYTCKYFSELNTSLGILMECKRPMDDRFKLERRGSFEPKKKCVYYENKNGFGGDKL